MSASAHIRPPKVPLRLLKWFCDPDLIEDVEGDLSELFALRYAENKFKARLLFFWDVLLLFRPGIIRSLQFLKGQTQITMLTNYFKVALRNALRYKGYTLLNLLGLVVGIATSILIMLWVEDEVSINRFHENGDQIYRVFRNMRQSGGMVNTVPSVPKPAGDLVKAEYSEVDRVVWMSWPIDNRITLADQTMEETGRFVNPDFLEMFSFELLIGDKSTALAELNSMVISEELAEKLFGADWREKAIGSLLKLGDGTDVQVSGVAKNIGPESTIDFEWLLPAQAFVNANPWINNWGNGSFSTFLLIPDEEKAATVAERILMEIKNNTANNPMAGDEELIIQKFEDTYLYSNFDNGEVSGGRIDYVRVMFVVALFILAVACINFMNLTTARSSRRSKEIGLRKVMGAPKGSIRTQFFFEAILLTSISVAISVLVVLLLLPYFNHLVDKALVLDFTLPRTWYFLLGLALGVGLLSGSYPALLLQAFNVVQSVKGGPMKQSALSIYIRKGLVIFQFAISTLLILGTTVIYQQMDYILNKDLGMDKENLVAVSLSGDLASRMEAYKSELLRLPDVSSVSAASGNPLNYGRSTSSASWEGKDPSKGYEVNVIISDEDFIETSGMEMLAGRAFSQQMQDSTNFIINEVAAELMGFEDPLDKRLSFWGINGRIVGVVKNFHMRDLYQPIAPLIITCIDPSRSAVALVKISGNTGTVLPEIEKITENLNPGYDFEYQFMDDVYAANYQNEQTLSTLVKIFAFISILISSLGLLGLASYSADQRSREIGVRKVHGASVIQILTLLSKEYSKLIVLALVLALPFGYLVASNWLDNFEFRTQLNPFLFGLASLSTFIIAVSTVAAKSYQAATVNPVKSLKEE